MAMKGQVFTMDLFTAYAIFMVMLLAISMMAFWVSSTILSKERTDDFSMGSVSALDYLCYGDDYTDAPYLMDKTAIDAFFAQSADDVRDELKPGWNYTLKLEWINGTGIHTVGDTDYTADDVISYHRYVYYNGDAAELIMMIWEVRGDIK